MWFHISRSFKFCFKKCVSSFFPHDSTLKMQLQCNNLFSTASWYNQRKRKHEDEEEDGSYEKRKRFL